MYFGKRPDLPRQEHLRQYQLHLLNDRKLTVDTIVGQIAALRFFFVKVLRRSYRDIDLVYPKRPERLPVILSEEEAARLIESAATSYHRVIPSRAQLKSALHLQDLPERTLRCYAGKCCYSVVFSPLSLPTSRLCDARTGFIRLAEVST